MSAPAIDGSLTLREPSVRVIGTACPTCGWNPGPEVRGGPVQIGIVLDEVLHRLGRCPKTLVATTDGQVRP